MYSLFLLFSGIVVLEFIALYSIKYYSLHKNLPSLLLSCLCYALIPIILYFLLVRGSNIATVNITWNILSTIYGLFIGVMLFQEKISNVQWYGIAFGFLSLIFLCWEGKKQ